MNLHELRALLASKLDEFDEGMKNQRSLNEMKTLTKEIEELRARIDLAQEVSNARLNDTDSKPFPKEATRSVSDLTDDEVEAEYRGSFIRALRNSNAITSRDEELHSRVAQLRTKDAPTSNPYFQSAVDTNGGFIVPKDVDTMIREYKRTMEFDLSTLITVETTAFSSGSRVFEKLATITPFVEISEWDKIGEFASPQFEQKQYTMKDYAGILPIPNRLLQDTDNNLLAYVAKFIARKTLITRNSIILNTLKTFTKRTKAIAATDDLKDILNIELDGAFSSTATIVTNQDGYNWLDKCKDSNGNYLMQKDVTSATGYAMFGVPVVVVPNRTLATTNKKAPVFIGDLKEAMILFDRGIYEVTGTTVGGKAFERNSYDIRVIDRFDVQKWDDGSVIYSEIDTSNPHAIPTTAPGNA